MEEKILACDNKKCLKSEECERYRLFENGAKEFKTHNGNPDKGCGKFIAKKS